MRLRTFLAVSAILLPVFFSCRKQQRAVSGDAKVNVRVLKQDGSPYADGTVCVYDETRGDKLDEHPFTEPLAVVRTDSRGEVVYTMSSSEWFSSEKQRFITFAVVIGVPDNYRIWSVGRTLEAGQTLRVDFRLDGYPEDPSVGPSEAVLQSIYLKSVPAKVTYTLDEPLDITGLEVMGRYDDGTEHPLQAGMSDVKGFDSSVPSENMTLTVEVSGKSTEFSVSVLPLRVEDGILLEVLDGYSEISLPGNIKGIADGAFSCRSVTKVILNEGLRSIGEMAFCNTQITSVDFPSTLETIGKNAFYRCAALTSADFGGTAVTSISDAAFASTGLREIVWPERLVHIGAQAFMDTPSLSEVRIPEGVRTIGVEAFRGCGAERILVPNSVRTIDTRAFYTCASLREFRTYGEAGNTADGTIGGSCFGYCPELAHLDIPLGAATLGQGLLGGNTMVKSLTIPENVRMISFAAFDGTGITDVTVKSATPPSVGLVSGQWYGLPKGTVRISVPAGTAAAYRAADGWNSFADVISE